MCCEETNLQLEGDGGGSSPLARAHHLPADVLEIKLLCKIKANPGESVSHEMGWVGGRWLMVRQIGGTRLINVSHLHILLLVSLFYAK